MSRVDWRRILDVSGTTDGVQGFLTLEVTDAGQLCLGLQLERTAEAGHAGPLPEPAELLLDFSDAGQLLDWLREALGVQLLLQGDGVAGAALTGLHAAQRGAGGLSDPSDSIQPRG